MAQNNLARQIVEQPVENPTTLIEKQPEAPQPVWKLKLSGMEKLLIIGGCAVLCLLMIGVVSSKIALSNSQQQLQRLDNRIVKLHNGNTSLNQQISELQSSSRLNQIAKQNGMSLNNANIRNVTK